MKMTFANSCGIRNICEVTVASGEKNNSASFKCLYTSDEEEVAIIDGNISDGIITDVAYRMNDEPNNRWYANSASEDGVNTLIVPAATKEKVRWLHTGLAGVLSEYYSTQPETKKIGTTYVATVVANVAIVEITDNRISDSDYVELDRVVTELANDGMQRVVITSERRIEKLSEKVSVDTTAMDNLKRLAARFTIEQKNYYVAAARLVISNPELKVVNGFRATIEHPDHNTVRYVYDRKRNVKLGILPGRVEITCACEPGDDESPITFEVVSISGHSDDLLDSSKFRKAERALIDTVERMYVPADTTEEGYQEHFAVGNKKFLITQTDVQDVFRAIHSNSFIEYLCSNTSPFIKSINVIYLG